MTPCSECLGASEGERLFMSCCDSVDVTVDSDLSARGRPCASTVQIAGQGDVESRLPSKVQIEDPGRESRDAAVVDPSGL